MRRMAAVLLSTLMIACIIYIPITSAASTLSVLSGEPLQGAYVDAVKLVASNFTKPVSSVVSLDKYQTSRDLYIRYSMTSSGSGFGHIELYYREGDQGSFTKYTLKDNPTGQWYGSPIPFHATSDGTYEFFTRAFDNGNRSEDLKTEAEASTYVDTTRPVTSATLNGTMGLNGWYVSEVTATFGANDSGSGIDEVQYSIDYAPWNNISANASVTISKNGTHELLYRSIDRAGNVGMTNQTAVNIDSTPPDVSFNTANDTEFDGSNATIDWSIIRGDSGIMKIEASVDGGPFQSLGVPSNSTQLKNLDNGDHYIIVRSQDMAGNTAESRLNFTVLLQSRDVLGNLGNSPLLPLGILVLTFAGVMMVLTIVKRRKKG